MFKLIFRNADGTEEEDDELFETEDEAQEAGLYGLSCMGLGREILHMSNPGDYPLSDDDEMDFYVAEC